MEKKIYEKISRLRPSKRRPSDPALDNRPPPASSESALTEESPAEQIGQETELMPTAIDFPGNSHSAASLQDLQSHSPLPSTEPATPAPQTGGATFETPETESEPEQTETKRSRRRRKKLQAKLNARSAKAADADGQRKRDAQATVKRQEQNDGAEINAGPDLQGLIPAEAEAVLEPPEPAAPTTPALASSAAEQFSGPTESPTTSLRQDWAANRLRKGAARQAIAEERERGKARIAVAKRRSRNKDYLMSKIPSGDSTKSEIRKNLRTARSQAAGELKQVQAEAAAQVRAVLNETKGQTDRRRSQRRREDHDRNAHLASSRLQSIRLGLAGSWVGIVGFTWYLWDIGRLRDDELLIPLAAIAAATLTFTLVPWKRILEKRVSSILIFLWLGVLAGGMAATAPFHESTLGLFIGATWIVIYAGVLLAPLGFAATTSLTLAAYGVAISISPTKATDYGQGFRVAALAATALIVGITIHELRSRATETVRHLHALDRQREVLRKRESELMQLYEVSRTIGLGEDLREVLPELVARTAGYVEAKVGLVVLHRPEQEILAALSPIWVAGQALEAEGYEFAVGGDATAATVFETGAPYMANRVDSVDLSGDRMLADLGVERVAAVPLRVEGRTIGALIVADKATDFTQADLDALELLATPAGLVLDHLARYEESQETGRRMAELAQLKSDFVSVVSHELRTPLTSVIGALSTMARPELAPDNPTSLSLLDSASTQANRLKLLIEDLLTVSKIDNEALPIRLEVTDIDAVLNRIIEIAPAWQERVTVDVAPLLPPVAVDVEHFNRAVSNLLDNAYKYAEGNPIELTARAVQDEVWVSVVDHGEGIPHEYHNTIFERFTQIERPDTRFKGGTGLGLNIVKDLTKSMGGRVWLEQTPDGGATFTLAFPRAAEDMVPSVEAGAGMLLVDPSRDRVEAPINVDDLSSGSDSPIAE